MVCACEVSKGCGEDVGGRGENQANPIKEIDLPPHKIDFPHSSQQQAAGGQV